MGINNSLNHLLPLKGYQPKSIPQSLRVMLGKQERMQKDNKFEFNTVTIDQFTMLYIKVRGGMKNFEAGQEVRKGWKKLQGIISSESSITTNQNEGIVFYNQGNMVQSDDTIELSVGVKVNELPYVPEGCKSITIPRRKYAKVVCRCFSRDEMGLRYSYLNEWIKEEGYQIEKGPDAFSLEPNRLDKFNTFEIPAHVIQAFDFDILYPIKRRDLL
ncbi:GyrI-like domain-containing protein [Bacillus infantis]|uniref:GyrI-like domain-containing protein n=1 Tax=Bacillus infantis TaxID=324767 RepID=A0A5D4SAB7_9BACI|nr:GyrI-like domain-containing protein [Bacillus infantis]TYS60587.1 GyrI-like domain-containing protein [Bacillus infantis]